MFIHAIINSVNTSFKVYVELNNSINELIIVIFYLKTH